MTGLPCPGCNMTTALYWLLRGDLPLSFWYHPMVIPTILAVLLCVLCRKQAKTVQWILIIWGTMMLICYLWRMLTVFPEAPMQPVRPLFSEIMNWSTK